MKQPLRGLSKHVKQLFFFLIAIFSVKWCLGKKIVISNASGEFLKTFILRTVFLFS